MPSRVSMPLMHRHLSAARLQKCIAPIQPAESGDKKILYKVISGTQSDEYEVNEALLLANSGFWASRFHASEPTSTDGLPAETTMDQPFIHLLMIEWLTTGHIVETIAADSDFEKGAGEVEDKDTPTWEHLFDLWILAQELRMPRLQNYVMTRLYHRHDFVGVDDTPFADVYERTRPNPDIPVDQETAAASRSVPLRRFIVDSAVLSPCTDSWDMYEARLAADHYPKRLLLDLCAGFARRVQEGGKRGSRNMNIEEYFVADKTMTAQPAREGESEVEDRGIKMETDS